MCKLLLSSQKDFKAIVVVVVEGYLIGLDVDFSRALSQIDQSVPIVANGDTITFSRRSVMRERQRHSTSIEQIQRSKAIENSARPQIDLDLKSGESNVI